MDLDDLEWHLLYSTVTSITWDKFPTTLTSRHQHSRGCPCEEFVPSWNPSSWLSHCCLLAGFLFKLKSNYFCSTHLNTTISLKRSLPACSDIGGAGKTNRVRVHSLSHHCWRKSWPTGPASTMAISPILHMGNKNPKTAFTGWQVWVGEISFDSFTIPACFQYKFVSVPEEKNHFMPGFTTCRLPSQKPPQNLMTKYPLNWKSSQNRQRKHLTKIGGLQTDGNGFHKGGWHFGNLRIWQPHSKEE